MLTNAAPDDLLSCYKTGFVLVICLREVSKTVKSKFSFEKKDCNFDALIKILCS